MIQPLPGTDITASALEAERLRMQVVSQNIAHANTTRGVDGKPYQRQEVVFEKALTNALSQNSAQGVQVARITVDDRPPRMVYQPGHPDADPNGMVAYPDINIHEEMADLIASSRAFEANLAVARNAKSMALQTLSIGKR